jgi:hypothetical protein
VFIPGRRLTPTTNANIKHSETFLSVQEVSNEIGRFSYD